MASDLIDRKALGIGRCKEDVFADRWYAIGWNNVIEIIEKAPAVDAIPIDTVAEMLADLFGDCCPCNYNDLDEVLSIGCERKSCPGFFEDDYSCWKKYAEWWKVMKDAVD